MGEIFKFTGLPGNEPFEVEDKKSRKNRINLPPGLENINDMLSDIEFSDFGLSEEEMNKLESKFMNQFSNLSEDELINMLNEALGNVSEKLGIHAKDLGIDISIQKENTPERFVYELSDISYLNSSLLGSVPCKKDQNLLQKKINEILGSNLENFRNVLSQLKSGNSEIPKLFVDDTGIEVLKEIEENFGDIKLIEGNEMYSLYFVNTNNPDEYGVYIVFTLSYDGELCLTVPVFGNTFKMFEGEFDGFFNKTVETPFFNGDKFIPENKALLNLSIKSILVPYVNSILTPNQFGEFEGIIPSITVDSNFLRIGNIISNESTDAILFKKDADLPLEETSFPFYLNFGRTVSAESLNTLGRILFNNRNELKESLLFQVSELKFSNDKKIYIDVDFGETFY